MKKYLVIIMAIVMFGSIGMIGGCKSKEDTAGQSEIVVSNFEQWGPDFQLLRLVNDFGRVSQNENAAYVKSGKRSAKLQPIGRMSDFGMPMLIVPLSSAVFDFSYTNFSRVVRVTAQLFNAQNDVRKVAMGLVSDIRSVNTINITSDEFRDIKPGWNQLTYNVDLSVINLVSEKNEFDGIYFMFYRADSRDIDAAPVYYLDDVKLELSAEDNEIVDLIDQKKYEICDFEQLYEDYVMSIECPKPEIRPEIGVVSLSQYGIASKGGEGRKALRVLYKPGSEPGVTWPKVIMSAKLIKTAAAKLTAEELAMPYAALCYDVYNNTDGPRVLYMDAFNSLGVPYTRKDVIPCGEWRTIILPLSRIYDKNKAEVSSNIHVSYGEYVGNDEEWFIDNYRFVTDYRPVAYEGYSPLDVYGK